MDKLVLHTYYHPKNGSAQTYITLRSYTADRPDYHRLADIPPVAAKKLSESGIVIWEADQHHALGRPGISLKRLADNLLKATVFDDLGDHSTAYCQFDIPGHLGDDFAPDAEHSLRIAWLNRPPSPNTSSPQLE